MTRGRPDHADPDRPDGRRGAGRRVAGAGLAGADAANHAKAPVAKITVIDREHGQSRGDYTFPYDYGYTDARRTMIQVRRPAVAVADYLKSLPRR